MSISQIEYYIPSTALYINDLIQKVEEDSLSSEFPTLELYENFIKDFLKLESIRVETQLEAHEMIEKVVNNAIEKEKFKPEDIDLIFFVPGAYKRKFENIGQYVQYKCGMNNAFTIELSGNDCVNIEMAVKIGVDLLKVQNNYKNILIVGAAKIDDPNARIIGSYGVYGDAAGLILLNLDNPIIRCHDVVNISNGKLYGALIDKVSVLDHCKYLLKSLNNLMNRNNLKDIVIDDVIIQNANPLLTKQCLNSKGYKEELIFKENLSAYGHLNQLDFLVNIKDLLDRKKEEKQRNFITLGFGWAGSYVSSFMSY